MRQTPRIVTIAALATLTLHAGCTSRCNSQVSTTASDSTPTNAAPAEERPSSTDPKPASTDIEPPPATSGARKSTTAPSAVSTETPSGARPPRAVERPLATEPAPPRTLEWVLVEKGQPIPAAATTGGTEILLNESQVGRKDRVGTRQLFICGAQQPAGTRSVQPGRLAERDCEFEYGDRSARVRGDGFFVLVGDGEWRRSAGTAGAMTGLDSFWGRLFICRFHLTEPEQGNDYGWHPGKLLDRENKCRISVGEKVFYSTDYELLYQKQ
jgi:hypothetical protein